MMNRMGRAEEWSIVDGQLSMVNERDPLTIDHRPSTIDNLFRRIFCLIILLLLGIGTPLLAQVRVDSTHLETRQPDPAALADAKANPAYQYTKAPVEAVSAWTVFWNWVTRQIGSITRSPVLRPVWRVLPYVLFAVVVLYVLLRLLQTDVRGVFFRQQATKLPFQVDTEDLEAINFEARIAEAVQASHYREAVRYGYLRVLKMLVGQGLIHWQPDKTNRAYLHEISLPALHTPFAELTRWFAYVWYGDRPIDAEAYQEAQVAFARFERQLQEARPQ